MDSNAHSTLWNNPYDCPRGEKLEAFLAREGLVTLNRGDKHTFSGRGKTMIDITFATPEVADNITHWQVTNETNFSDHRLIAMNLKEDKPNIKYKRNFKNVDWD